MAKRVTERSSSMSLLDGAETRQFSRDAAHPRTGRKDRNES